MPLGIVSEQDFEKEVDDLNKPALPIVKIVDIERGRGKGNGEVPSGIRKIISEEFIQGTSGKELSEVFGISQSSISAYSRGATSTSTYDKPDEDLVKANNRVRQHILTKSRKKLELALDNITEEKLKDTKALDLSSIARNMASVSDAMEQKVVTNITNNAVIVFRPRQKAEEEFETIVVNE